MNYANLPWCTAQYCDSQLSTIATTYFAFLGMFIALAFVVGCIYAINK